MRRTTQTKSAYEDDLKHLQRTLDRMSRNTTWPEAVRARALLRLTELVRVYQAQHLKEIERSVHGGGTSEAKNAKRSVA